MKPLFSFILAILLTCCLLVGCTVSVSPSVPPLTTVTTTTAPAGTTAGTAQTQCAQILEAVWQRYEPEERFSAYGGSIEHAVEDNPGDLAPDNIEELTTRYLIPQDRVGEIAEAASLVHLMNSNIFTAVAVRLSDGGEIQSFAGAWRDALQKNRWICGSPDRILIVQLEENFLVTVFASEDNVYAFHGKLASAFPNAVVLFEEPILA